LFYNLQKSLAVKYNMNEALIFYIANNLLTPKITVKIDIDLRSPYSVVKK